MSVVAAASSNDQPQARAHLLNAGVSGWALKKGLIHSLILFFVFVLAPGNKVVHAEGKSASDSVHQNLRQTLQAFCLNCHNNTDRTADLDFSAVAATSMAENRVIWEKVVRKLRSRQMPPVDAHRPNEETYDAVLRSLEPSLDQISEEHPSPGRTETFRRLTRTEYQNSIRDLLSLDIDAADLLPKDESSQGFDNITVGDLSPTLLNRYVAAAEKISRLAVGGTSSSPDGDTFRVRPDITQERHVPGLPIGTRGGTLIPYNFPQTGEYEIRIRLARDRNEEVEGLQGRHELEVLLDRQRMQLFVVKPPPDGSKDYSKVDAHLVARVPVEAGPHRLGVTFLGKSASLIETDRQPYQARFNRHRHPRTAPAVYQVSITGPYDANGPGDTPSRRRIFVRAPKDDSDEEARAKTILTSLARRAWRRPITESDLQRLMSFFHRGRQDGGFDAGIEAALAAVLVNPLFLFRIERDPPDLEPGSIYPLRDLELASRLSFFLWSSIPDDGLLSLAERRELSRDDVLNQQVRRMLADERAHSLVTGFAGQWLHLRNLDSVHPDMRLFPDFDDNLRQAMRKETELLFETVMREDLSVLDLLRADYTFLNERLAKHYELPHVHGSRFRRVDLSNDDRRGGLLKHASILTVTSYATRTSPVIRGHWILKNLMGSAPPPPPADVPALKDNTVAAGLTVRERLAQHRKDASCAVCHNVMDPVGFSLEHFDAIGRRRDLESGRPIDATGGLPDGSRFSGVDGLKDSLLQRPELFVGTLTEKLMTFALGRGVDELDAAAVRKIVRNSKADGYRFSSLIQGIVGSAPFRMRTAE